MKQLLSVIFIFVTLASFSQEKEKEQLLAMKKANNYIYEGNALLDENDMISAEMEYRKAISELPNSAIGNYNLGTSYIKNGNFDEAVYRLEAAAKSATSKSEKHKAYHNIGNVLMQGQKCKEAVEAYKNALRNNPADQETRYNLAVAKDCAEKQQNQNQNQDQNQEDKNNSDQQQDENKENKDNQDNQDQEGDNDQNDNNEGDQDNNEGEDEKDDKGQPEDQDKNQGNDGDKEKEPQQPKPQPGQLSPQQIQNLLEAMNNQEQKVQEKMNAEKQKGVIIKTDKDW